MGLLLIGVLGLVVLLGGIGLVGLVGLVVHGLFGTPAFAPQTLGRRPVFTGGFVRDVGISLMGGVMLGRAHGVAKVASGLCRSCRKITRLVCLN
jgi:hypothetical protein